METEDADGATAPAVASLPKPTAAAAEAAARAQAEGLAAVAVCGHPALVYNATFRRSEPALDGYPQYVLDLGNGDSLYLFRHEASQRWVFSFATGGFDMEGPATILAPEGPVPLGDHSWRHQGEDVRLTVTALVTAAEVEESIEQSRAEAERVEQVAEQAACNAAREQLADVAGVTVEGMLAAEYTAVYLPAGDHKGWQRFESVGGKHLYRDNSEREWYLHERFDPEGDEDPDAFAAAGDGLLPVGVQQWMCFDDDTDEDDWKGLPLTVSLLATDAEAETAAERLREVRERQLGAEKSAKEEAEQAACNAAKHQLTDVAGVTIEGLPAAEYNAVYLPAGYHQSWQRFESVEGNHIFRYIRDKRWYLLDRFDPETKGPVAFMEAVDGLLPVGEQQWKCVADQQWKDVSVTLMLLAAGAEEVKEAERRVLEREVEWQERQKRLPKQMEIYRKRYIPEDEKERDVAEVEQRAEAAESNPTEAAATATAAADQGNPGVTTSAFACERAAALTISSGQHGEGTGISLAGIDYALERVLASKDKLTEATTTSDLFKAHTLPVTMPEGWTKSWPEVTNAANSWYTHHYIEDATGVERFKANGKDPDPPPGTHSLCAKLAADPETAHFVGTPTHFLSHAHTYCKF